MTDAIAFDDFLPSYDELRSYANTAKFEDTKSPFDDVVYPLICKDIPQHIKNDVAVQISKKMKRMVKMNAVFMRLSTEGVNAPQECHHDLTMGRFSLILYLSDCDSAGTAFVKHKGTGATYAQASEEITGALVRDQNKPEAWQELSRVVMKQNRATIFDAGELHKAEPAGGFGDSNKTGRIILGAFYD